MGNSIYHKSMADGSENILIQIRWYDSCTFYILHDHLFLKVNYDSNFIELPFGKDCN